MMEETQRQDDALEPTPERMILLTSFALCGSTQRYPIPSLPGSQCFAKLCHTCMIGQQEATAHQVYRSGGLDRSHWTGRTSAGAKCKLHAVQSSHSGQWWKAGGNKPSLLHHGTHSGGGPTPSRRGLQAHPGHHWKSLPRTRSHDPARAEPALRPPPPNNITLPGSCTTGVRNAGPRQGTKGTKLCLPLGNAVTSSHNHLTLGFYARGLANPMLARSERHNRTSPWRCTKGPQEYPPSYHSEERTAQCWRSTNMYLKMGKWISLAAGIMTW